MEVNFDKEIDALLRQAARGEDFLNENPPTHVDADEISAFAENALPQAAKMRMTEHLADCARCRKILANVISFNEEIAAEVIPATEKIEKAIPWYKRLFAFPQIAYAMGALVLVFSGVIGILVYQSVEQTANLEMAKAPVSEPAGRGPNAQEEMPVYQNELVNTSNMTMTNANVAATPQISMANTSANFPVTESRTFSANTATANTTAANTAKIEDLARESSRENQLMTAPPPPKPQAPVDAETLRDKEKREVAKAAEKDSPDKKVMQKAPAPGSGAGLVKEDNEGAKLKTQSREAATRQISGKTFNRKDGVWYDAAYRGQGTTNIRRRTEEYRMLDRGLRIIAESLEGTVVVIWNEKAYRFQ